MDNVTSYKFNKDLSQLLGKPFLWNRFFQKESHPSDGDLYDQTGEIPARNAGDRTDLALERRIY